MPNEAKRSPVPDSWSPRGINIDVTALSNIVIAQENNMFCGVMNLVTKTIYLAALHGYAAHEVDKKGVKLNGYGTVNPPHATVFPQLIPLGGVPSSADWLPTLGNGQRVKGRIIAPIKPRPHDDCDLTMGQRVKGRIIAPIKHKDPGNPKEVTSHDQFVIAIGGGEENFCGFALRFEASQGKLDVKLSPTSRSLNPGFNGCLEECIFDAVYRFLGPKLALLGMKLIKVEAGTDPNKAGLARMLASGAIDNNNVAAVQQQQRLRPNLFADILKKRSPP